MDKKSKILITVFIVVIIVSIFFTYKRSFVDKNFIIEESEEEEIKEGLVEEMERIDESEMENEVEEMLEGESQ